jgi:hypothetical protein
VDVAVPAAPIKVGACGNKVRPCKIRPDR